MIKAKHIWVLFFLLTARNASVRPQAVPGSSIVSRTVLSSDGTRKLVQRVYDNGLGDIVQEIQSCTGSALPGIAVHHEYDEHRRRTRSWLPEGLDTECSESGGGLSEGQAQRISIARALLRDRSIMLFDEATSALDPDTERQLLQNILATHEKTIIFITHRLAVVDYCDQTLQIEKL